MLIPTSALPAFTALHVAISLAAIASGFVVLFGMIAGKRLDRWTAFFLGTTVLTSVTGFGFPIRGMTPGIAFGIISLVVLAAAIYARYPRHLAGLWRPVYVVGAMFAFYLNFVVLIVQSFQKVRAAPRPGAEPERAAFPRRADRLDGRVPHPRDDGRETVSRTDRRRGVIDVSLWTGW